MPSKEHAGHRADARRRRPQPAGPVSHSAAHQPTDLAPLTSRAQLNAGLLSARDVMQLQRAVGNRAVGRLLAHAPPRHAPPAGGKRAGLPDALKAGVESLAGRSMDDVRVHYDAPEPARYRALAYAQGTDIYLAPGQEEHLPHEAWHVAQQKQGRVAPAARAPGASVNRDAALEREADVMGARAAQGARAAPAEGRAEYGTSDGPAPPSNVVQLRPENQQIVGITHLVRMVDGSLYAEDFLTNEVMEVESGDIVQIETDVSYLSRRGPNQEINSQADKFGPQQHEWFEVLKVNGRRLDVADVFVRAGTFIPLAEESAAEVSENPLTQTIEKMLRDVGAGLSKGNMELATGLVMHILKQTGVGLDELHMTSSSGISVTVIPDRGGVVYQFFVSDTPYEAIKSFYDSGVFEAEHQLKAGTTFGPSKKYGMAEARYRTRDYLAGIVDFLPQFRSVVFEKIVPLNVLFRDESESGKDKFTAFLKANALKIVWDISKALEGLIAKGYSQGDVRLDNIGIKDGRFVLFDYDKVQSKDARPLMKDLKTLSESFLSHKVEGLEVDFRHLLRELKGDTLQQKFDYLEKLAIQK